MKKIESWTDALLRKINKGLGYQAFKINAASNFIPRISSVVTITTRCNFNCPHCLRLDMDKKKTIIKDLPVEIFEQFLIEGKRIGLNYVFFSGGEPILHPNFEKLVFLASQHDCFYTIASNGWLHNKYWDIISKYRKNFDEFHLSLDGTTAEVHDAVRAKPGSFERLIKSIKFYRKKELQIKPTFVVTKKNFHQLGGLIDFCLGFGIKAIKISGVLEVGDEYTKRENENKFLKSINDREILRRKVIELRKKYRHIFSVEFTTSLITPTQICEFKTINLCRSLSGEILFLDQDGALLPCCDISKDYIGKPLIQEVGFEKALALNLDLIAEIKKKFLHELIKNPKKNITICDFCNKVMESFLFSNCKTQETKKNY